MSERGRGDTALTVTTVEIPDLESLTDYFPPREQLVWLRRGEGIAGFGVAWRREFFGPNRFADAAAAWRERAAHCSIDDPLGIPGTGLVAFGSFAFSDRSSAASVLIIPSLVLGRRDGKSWLTRIRGDGDAEQPWPRKRASDSADGPATRVAFAQGDLSSQGFLDAVDVAIARIGGGRVSKVVLARDIVGAFPPDGDTARALSLLASGYPDCWTFAVDDFLGSSPETLVRVADGTVGARVLAGSAARGVDAATDQQASVALATSAKDQDEHQYAVQSVLAALRPHSPGVTASEMPFTLRLPNLWHLASDVEGMLADGSSSLDLIGALHPTAAVAGTPTTAAIELIDELEPFDRGRYAGPVGWVGSDGDGEWAIALRCAHVGEKAVHAFAGAGIVAESVAEHELAETSLKFRPIVEAFSV